MMPDSALTRETEAGQSHKFELNDFSEKLRAASSRWKALFDQQEPRETEALAELTTALEELNVADEELRVQNQALREAYLQVEKERLHYEELFALVPDAYLVTDAYATILEANRAAEQLLGMSIDRMRGKPLAVFIAEEQRREFRANLNRAVIEDASCEWSAMLTPRTGTPLRVLLRSCLIHGSADHQRLGWIIQDTTDRQRVLTLGQRFTEEQSARIEAERAARRFRALAEISRLIAAETDVVAICQSTAKTVIRFLADHCEVAFADDGKLRTLASFNREPRQASLLNALQRRYHMRMDDPDSLVWRAFQNNETQVFPALATGIDAYSRKDLFAALRETGPRNAIAIPLSLGTNVLGVMVALGNSPTPLFGPEEVGVLIEIATRASLALRNAQLFHQLESANLEKTEFMSVLSHELRTPLTAVIGYADLLLSGIPEPLPDAARDQIERIRSCSWHQLSVVEQILKYARVESGKDQPTFTSVNVHELVNEVMQVAQIPEPNAKVRLKVDVPPGSIIIKSDPGRMRQILLNLLSNAFKFTDAGAVSLTVRRTDDDVFFTIADTGIGIDVSDLDRIFDPFWRGQPAKTPRTRTGMGLGLAVSGQLARSLGGDLTVQSQLGVGTVFTLRLPMR